MKTRATFTLLLSLASLFLLAPGVARAQASASSWANYPFWDVRDNHWAYQSVDSLREAGILVGYPDGSFTNDTVPFTSPSYRAKDVLEMAGILVATPDWTGSGRQRMTRHEFTRAIAFLVPLLYSTGANTGNLTPLWIEMQKRLDNNQKALDALKSLVIEFQPELKEEGVNSGTIKARISVLEEQLAAQEVKRRPAALNAPSSSAP